jgi:5-methylcytosine-specific restriction enzyme A
MPRAPKICPAAGCTNTQPCNEHTPTPWATSTRRARTLSGSAQQKRARHILMQHDAICHACGNGGADEVDHVIPLAEGGADDESNLRPIHSRPCHAAKSAREAQRGRRSGR